MKITTFLMFIAFMQVSASGLAQKFTLVKKNVTLKEIFREINKQTGYNIFGSDGNELSKKIDADFKDAGVLDVLDKCLENTSLTYSAQDKTIVIKQREASLLDKITDKAAKLLAIPSDINGTVVDSTGKALAGATIVIKGTSFNAITDDKGQFHFSKVPPGTYTLFVSYLGYTRQENSIVVKGKDLTVRFVLSNSVSVLDQVRVIGYGTDTKRFSVGSVATVTAGDIEKQPVTNVLLALEGQAPGLAINPSSGVPGASVLVQVRGQNTIMNNSSTFKPYDQPLFVIDGVPFAPQNTNTNQLSNLAQGSGFSGGISQLQGLSPFNGINPADIESVSILKDADATSIYGTQGSNGVILITTKKGKAGKTILNVTANTSFSAASDELQLMNTPQYLQLRKDAFAADNITPTTVNGGFFSPGYAPDLLIFDQNKYTDWQKIITGKTANNTDIHTTLSGGTANNTFLVSGGYTRSDVNFPGDFADQRFTLHSNLHSSSANNRLSVDFGADIGYDQNNEPGYGGASRVLLPPNLPSLMDAQGNLLWSYKGVNLTPYQFYGYLKTFADMQNYNFNNSLRLSYKILPGLSISANLGYSRNTSSEHSEDPDAAQNPATASPSANFATGNAQTIIVEPQISYTHTSGKGVLDALVGGTYKKNISNSTQTEGIGYANDNFLGSINGASTIYASDASNTYKYSAAFARLKYVYDQKYIISLTGRRDGSSNFGPDRQFGNFGSAGLGWIFSEEGFFKTAMPFISYAKLSANYGTSGSDGIQSYQYQSFWQPLGSVPAFQGIKPDIPINLYNPDYSWALKKSLNTALDLGFFHDRLLINATYYRDREGNQLIAYPLPNQVGLTSVIENLPATIQNSGWEFTATSTNIRTNKFRWTTTFNISFNRNKLLAFPNLATSSYRSLYVIGQPTSVIMGYRYKDVNPQTGLFEFYKKNGQVTSTPTYGLAASGGDMVPIGNREVKYMGGFGNTLSYGRLSLSAFFQFSSQMAPNYLATLYGNYSPGLSISNLPVAALDYWKKSGDQTPLQRLTASYFSSAAAASGAFTSSSGAYSDDTYLRLKTVSLSCKLPEALLKTLHIREASIFANAQNLLTFTDFKVTDPEQFGNFAAFPLQRTIAFGLNFNF